MRVVFVHGACVRDGAWWWHLAANRLGTRGVTSTAAVLPSCEASPPLGFDDDVAAVRDLLDADTEPTIVVAHSYGGIVTAQAAAGVDHVQHLLLISSYLPEPGESLSSFGGPEPAPFLDVDPAGGTFTVRPEAMAETFMQDCPEFEPAARDRLVRQSLSVLPHAVTASAWKQVPSTYVVCTQDRGTPVEAQRDFARRATKSVEIEAGHHPFLSQPAAVADLITSLA